MSLLVRTNIGKICIICTGEYFSNNQQVKYKTCGNHEGFHKDCLLRWLNESPICPFRCQTIDPNSLISLADRIMRTLRTAFVNAACATFIGGAGAVVGKVLLEGAAIRGAIGVAIGAGGDLILEHPPIEILAHGNNPFIRTGLGRVIILMLACGYIVPTGARIVSLTIALIRGATGWALFLTRR